MALEARVGVKTTFKINLFRDIVFTNGPGDRGSILGRVIPKTQKMVLNAALLSTQHYKVRIKGKVEHSRKRSSALPYTSSEERHGGKEGCGAAWGSGWQM